MTKQRTNRWSIDRHLLWAFLKPISMRMQEAAAFLERNFRIVSSKKPMLSINKNLLSKPQLRLKLASHCPLIHILCFWRSLISHRLLNYCEESVTPKIQWMRIPKKTFIFALNIGLEWYIQLG